MHILLHSVTPTLKQATPDPCLYWRLPDTHRQVWGSLLWGHCSFFWVLVHQVLLCLPVYFPVLCKFWELYDGINGDLLQEDLCHPLSNHNPGPGGRLLPTRTSIGDTQTQFYLSLCGVPGSWRAQVCLSPLSVSGDEVV